MTESIHGKSPGREVLYRALGLPAPTELSRNIQDLLTPAHPNRSGGLILRAGLNATRETIVYYQADGHSRSASADWKHYRDATIAERRMIHSLLADGTFVQVETSFGVLLYRKSEEAS